MVALVSPKSTISVANSTVTKDTNTSLPCLCLDTAALITPVGFQVHWCFPYQLCWSLRFQVVQSIKGWFWWQNLTLASTWIPCSWHQIPFRTRAVPAASLRGCKLPKFSPCCGRRCFKISGWVSARGVNRVFWGVSPAVCRMKLLDLFFSLPSLPPSLNF